MLRAIFPLLPQSSTIQPPTPHFPNNTIPTNLLNPAALKILGLLPGPNTGGTLNKTDNIETDNFVSVGSSHPTNNTGMARIDETVSDRLRLFATFVHFNDFSPIAPALPGSPLEYEVGPTSTTGYENTIGMTMTWSPTFITDLRFGYFRNNSKIVPPTNGINDEQTLGIANQYGVAAPEFTIDGFTTPLGTNSNTLRTQIDNNYQLIVNNNKSIRKSLAAVRRATPQE
jgi:hypothetical protein